MRHFQDFTKGEKTLIFSFLEIIYRGTYFIHSVRLNARNKELIKISKKLRDYLK